jgi:hypothetical protein
MAKNLPNTKIRQAQPHGFLATMIRWLVLDREASSERSVFLAVEHHCRGICMYVSLEKDLLPASRPNRYDLLLLYVHVHWLRRR